MSDTYKNNIVFGLALAGVLLTVNEMDNLNNYLKLQSFLVKFGLIGLATATIVVIWFRKKIFVSEKTAKTNWANILLTILGLVTLTISIGSKLNRQFSTKNPSCNHFEVIKKDFEEGRIRRFFIQASSSIGFREVTLKKEDWEGIKANEDISICDHRGLFGYDFSKLKD